MKEKKIKKSLVTLAAVHTHTYTSVLLEDKKINIKNIRTDRTYTLFCV